MCAEQRGKVMYDTLAERLNRSFPTRKMFSHFVRDSNYFVPTTICRAARFYCEQCEFIRVLWVNQFITLKSLWFDSIWSSRYVAIACETNICHSFWPLTNQIFIQQPPEGSKFGKQTWRLADKHLHLSSMLPLFSTSWIFSRS